MKLSEAVRYLEASQQGVLATLRSNGLPQLSNIMYSVIDGEVWVSVTDDRAKTRNVRRDPRAALHVTSPEFDSYVVVECDIELTATAQHPNDSVLADLRRLYRSMAGEHPDWDEYDAAMIADGRVILRLHPNRAYGMI